MAATSVTSQISPIQRRDMRSDAIPSKRDRDQLEKWSMGVRPSAGVSTNVITGEFHGGSESQRAKVRPDKPWTFEHKSHANINPKPTLARGYLHNACAGRALRKVDAVVESREHPLSKSVLELLPSHANNTQGSIHTAADAGIFFSFDRKESPRGNMDLGNLVDMAEKKWENERTERIVKGEYEVLDHEGGTVTVKKGKSPKQKPKLVVERNVEDDDDFELV